MDLGTSSVSLAVQDPALLGGLLAVGVLDAVCPPGHVVPGDSRAPWYEPTFDVLVTAFSGLSAVLVVFVPALCAPSHRRVVATLAFLAGAGLATSFASFENSLRVPWLAALGGGLASLVVAWRVFGRADRGPRGR